MDTKDLKVGDFLYEVRSYFGSLGINKVQITGETKTRWKLGKGYTQLYKKDLAEYGNKYGNCTYQIELTDGQKQGLENQKKDTKAKILHNKLGKYIRDNIGLPLNVEKCLEELLKDNK